MAQAAPPGPRVASAAPPGTAYARSSASETPDANASQSPGTSRFEGAEIIAWVGPDVILANDALFMVNRFLSQKEFTDKIAIMSREEMQATKIALMKKFMEPMIQSKLWLVAAKRELPSENLAKMEEQVNESFEKEQLRKLIDEYKAGSRSQLDRQLRAMGSSIEAQRRFYFERSLASLWQHKQVKIDEEVTHQQMLEYYRAHIADYETAPKARWEQLTIGLKRHSPQEARRLLAELGNQLLRGAPLNELAQKYSEDPSSHEGGSHPWTTQHSLVSEVLDKAIFGLPVGSLSPILSDDQGLHIVRVVERRGLERKSFTDVQAEIKTKIRQERTRAEQESYTKKLRREIPVRTVFDEEDKERATNGSAP